MRNKGGSIRNKRRVKRRRKTQRRGGGPTPTVSFISVDKIPILAARKKD